MTAKRKKTGRPTPGSTKPAGALERAAARSLDQVLDKSEQIKDDVEECAVELSTVNSALNEKLGEQPLPPALKAVLEKSETVESRVQACANDLSTVNEALKAEITERQLLEHQLQHAQQQEEAIRHAAFHDPLTSLPNRALFNDRLERGLGKTERSGGALAVMFLDLDGFKVINDSYGHAAGDTVLQTVARRLKDMTRNDDTVSRHGGDEFLYLLTELKSEADAIMIANKIQRIMAEPCRVRVNDADISLNIALSIGIAVFPADGSTAETLVSSADRAMYRAKQSRSGHALNRQAGAA